MSATSHWVLVAPASASSVSASGKTIFSEVAAQTGLDFEHFNGMAGLLHLPEIMGGGVALLDYDGDGDLDVYVGQGALYSDDDRDELIFPSRYPFPHTDRLYRNELTTGPDGEKVLRFTDVTVQAGLDVAVGQNMGVATGDYDNDGDIDVYLANLAANQLLRNNGDGTFTDVTAAARADDRRWTVTASFFDYDRDGWLDLFIGNYVEWRLPLKKQCTRPTGKVDYCGPLSYPALGNALLRNDRSGGFEDVTGVALPGAVAATTLGAQAADFNGDGWLDLYVANDMMPNHLWMNQRDGTLLEDGLIAGTSVDANGQPQASMGVIADDIDGDGDEDLFMTHLRMEMNTTYINDGSGLFEDRSTDTGLGRASHASTGFGTVLFDYDNDGTRDIFVANGAVHRIESQLRAGEALALRERNQLFRGLGEGRFEELPIERWSQEAREEVSRGVAAGDIDNDGDVDLVVVNSAGLLRLLRNQVGARNAWLGVRLLLADVERDALGAKAELKLSSGSSLHRRVHTDGSYASASDARLLFGMGESGTPRELVVRWPDGTRESFGKERLSSGTYVALRQGTGRPAPVARP